MSFTTFSFFGFFLAVLLLYYLLPHTARKLLLLAASYVFYMWSVPALGLVLLGTTLLSYGAGRLLDPRRHAGKWRVWVLAGCCTVHFGLLFICKYLQMVLDLAFRLAPGLVPQTTVDLVLPVGISFFTFAVTGYLFDVYRGKLAAERNVLDYAVFTAFFPCVLAGPIGQARSFLPQLKQRIPFQAEAVKAGVLRFVFGLFQKLVLADHIGVLVNAAYGGAVLSPLSWIAVILLYSLQIYFDFSGYSHMAIGLARALGLRVPENFNAPYLSTSVSSFWKKWHISLTSWFREYLYFPLGGSRKGRLRTYFNILIVFAVSGLWHGAAVHYVLWGLLNGLLQVLERMADRPRKRLEQRCQSGARRVLWGAVCGMATYLLISLTWLLFRVDGLAQLRFILGQVLGLFRTGFGPLQLAELGMGRRLGLVLALSLGLCTAVDALWLRGCRMRRLTRSVLPYYAVLCALILLTAVFGVYGAGFDPQDFVYFKY
ncbi:MAG: MBOAT family protein [Oscillospiraceae bacterium]|nr:MBOAT family protein [Oscillospiraceae bacterium]